MSVTFMESLGPEWEVDLKWHDDGERFAIFFGDGLGFMYDIKVPACEKCGVWHQTWAPHAPTMAFLERFVLANTRLPHWCDLVEDCPQDVRSQVRDFLDATGQWSEPKEGLTEEDATARTVGGMPVHTGEKDPRSMVHVVQPQLSSRLNQFVGVPNDERARAAMKDAIQEVMRPLAKDFKVEVLPDPVNEEVMRAQVVYEPDMAPREVRIVDAVVVTGVGEEGADGEGSEGRGKCQPEAPSSASRGEREDSSDMSSSGGEPG